MLLCVLLADAELPAVDPVVASSICAKAVVQSSMHNLHKKEASFCTELQNSYAKSTSLVNQGASTAADVANVVTALFECHGTGAT